MFARVNAGGEGEADSKHREILHIFGLAALYWGSGVRGVGWVGEEGTPSAGRFSIYWGSLYCGSGFAGIMDPECREILHVLELAVLRASQPDCQLAIQPASDPSNHITDFPSPCGSRLC